MGQRVKVVDSRHAHIAPGMFGTIEFVYPDGYAVHFTETQGYNGKVHPATVFMLSREIIEATESDAGGSNLVNESGV